MTTFTDNYGIADAAVRKMQSASYDKYSTHSYASGYLGTKLALIAAAHLTKQQFQEFLEDLESITETKLAVD